MQTDICTLIIHVMSRSVLLRMRNVSQKFAEKIKTHILFSIPDSENIAVYEIWEARDDNITRFDCCVTKATNTHSEYVIIIAFPRQHWLHERASVLRDT
jgi:hypothetical protein